MYLNEDVMIAVSTFIFATEMNYLIEWRWIPLNKFFLFSENLMRWPSKDKISGDPVPQNLVLRSNTIKATSQMANELWLSLIYLLKMVRPTTIIDELLIASSETALCLLFSSIWIMVLWMLRLVWYLWLTSLIAADLILVSDFFDSEWGKER